VTLSLRVGVAYILALSINQSINQSISVVWYSLQMICSYVLWPLAVVMGVHVADCRKVAEMIGTKTFLNEFVAYLQLSQLIDNRETLQRHVTDNGTWYWRGDDVILTSPGRNDSVLTNGVITVQLRYVFSQYQSYSVCY